jgi:hypothetical protein
MIFSSPIVPGGNALMVFWRMYFIMLDLHHRTWFNVFAVERLPLEEMFLSQKAFNHGSRRDINLPGLDGIKPVYLLDQ